MPCYNLGKRSVICLTQLAAVPSSEKKHNPILIPKAYQDSLDAFTKSNNFPGYGEAIQALLNCFKKQKDIKQGLDKREQDLDNREKELSAAEQEFLAYEQRLRDGSGVNQQTFGIIAGLIESGTDVESLTDLIISSGVPVAELAKGLQKLGGWANYLQQLAQQVELFQASAEAARKNVEALEDRRLELSKMLLAGRKEIDGLLTERDKAIQEIEAVIAQGRVVEETYARLGIVLRDVVIRLLGAGKPVTDLPEMGIRTLAGTILQVSIEIFGDEKINLPENIQAGRFMPMPLLLSEIPLMLAPPQVYQQVQERLATKEAE